jgi:hypothetical protein
MAAARELSGAARHAAYAAGQAAVVAHVAAHELGAAAYAIKAARAAAPGGRGESAGRIECRWQREQLPDAIRELVLEDQRLRNEICWSVFDCLSTGQKAGFESLRAHHVRPQAIDPCSGLTRWGRAMGIPSRETVA